MRCSPGFFRPVEGFLCVKVSFFFFISFLKASSHVEHNRLSSADEWCEGWRAESSNMLQETSREMDKGRVSRYTHRTGGGIGKRKDMIWPVSHFKCMIDVCEIFLSALRNNTVSPESIATAILCSGCTLKTLEVISEMNLRWLISFIMFVSRRIELLDTHPFV